MHLDTRPLRVDRDGIYVGPTALSKGSTICDFCSLKDNGCNLTPRIESCGQFVPALSFVPPLVGLEGSFSTYRASAIWFARAQHVMKTHRKVGLVNSVTRQLIGIGEITETHKGTFSDLMRDHAHTNHLTKDLGLTQDQADTWLRRWIRNHLGSMYEKNPVATGTVIYVDRQ